VLLRVIFSLLGSQFINDWYFLYVAHTMAFPVSGPDSLVIRTSRLPILSDWPRDYCAEKLVGGWNQRHLILDFKYSFTCSKPHEFGARSEGLLTLSAYGTVVSPHTLDFNCIFVYSWSLLDTEHMQLAVPCVHIQWTNCCRKVCLGLRSACHSGHIIYPCQHVRCLLESLSHCT